MDIITNTLYWLSTGLLVPVIVLLLLFFLRALLLGGSFYGQFIDRNKNNREIKKQLRNRKLEELSIEGFSEKQRKSNELVQTILEMVEKENNRAGLDKLIGDYEIIADKDLGKSRILSKLGPTLGLMGTLIPMGPALVALAVGDVASMASNMQVAFATTVIGLFIGAIGFVTLQTKQRWYADDMNILDFIADSITEKRMKNRQEEREP